MTYYLKFHDVELYDIWNKENVDLRQKVIALWHKNNILVPGTNAYERSLEIILVAVNSKGDVIGVNTAYRGQFALPPHETPFPCFYYRIFIQPKDRIPYLMRIMTKSAHEILSRDRKPEDPNTLAIIAENTGLNRPGMRRLLDKRGYKFVMKTPNGLSLFTKDLI